MRKPPKVVPITQAKGRRHTKLTHLPAGLEGRMHLLRCEQTPSAIHFYLGPPISLGEASTPLKRAKGKLVCFPGRPEPFGHDGTESLP